MRLCQSFLCPSLLIPWILHRKVFLCKFWSRSSKLQGRSLGKSPGSCGPGSLLVLGVVGTRIKFSAVIRAVFSEALCKSSSRPWSVCCLLVLILTCLCSQVLIFLKRTLRRGECDWGWDFYSAFQWRMEGVILSLGASYKESIWSIAFLLSMKYFCSKCSVGGGRDGDAYKDSREEL